MFYNALIYHWLLINNHLTLSSFVFVNVFYFFFISLLSLLYGQCSSLADSYYIIAVLFNFRSYCIQFCGDINYWYICKIVLNFMHCIFPLSNWSIIYFCLMACMHTCSWAVSNCLVYSVVCNDFGLYVSLLEYFSIAQLPWELELVNWHSFSTHLRMMVAWYVNIFVVLSLQNHCLLTSLTWQPSRNRNSASEPNNAWHGAVSLNAFHRFICHFVLLITFAYPNNSLQSVNSLRWSI